MFFILSKILAFFLKPYIWIIILAIWSYRSKVQKRRKILKYTTLAMCLFFTNTVILSEFLRKWEVQGKKQLEFGNFDFGVVLGGMAGYNADLDRIALRHQGDRIWQALNLYHAGKIKKIVLSGDDGYLTNRGLHEAKQMKVILVNWGIPNQDILTEENSRNTHENAQFTAKLLHNSYPYLKKGVLITSAIHMRRAEACFEKEGLKLEKYSTDHLTGPSRNYFWDQYIIPDLNTLVTWDQFIKEMVGYCAYKLAGYL